MIVPWKPSVTVGREMNPKLSVITGEGAQQRIQHPEPGKGSPAIAVWGQVPSLPTSTPPNYYDVPLLKEPVWIWSVPSYFYIGGVAGGSAVLAAVLRTNKDCRTLGSSCRWLAFLGTTIGPALLTWDLGRKFRFINMLRVFRPTSPMSIGSWSLAGSGFLATLSLLLGRRPAGAIPAWGLAGGGIMLAGYTGVLLANSANPLWRRSRLTLPVLFTASAMASTAGVLEMLPLEKREDAVVQRFGTIGKIAEAVSIVAMEREASATPRAASVFKEGKGGFLWKTAKALLAAGIVMNLIPFKSPLKRRSGALLTTAGAVCLRFALLELGKQAAPKPSLAIQERRQTTLQK